MSGQKRILVVEGDPDVRERIVESLTRPLLEVVSLGSGAQALAYAQREKPDLVVTELVLPDLTGLALTRLLREDPAHGHVGILMVTSYANEMDRVLAFECGVDDFLPKPFYGRELSSRVGAVLRRSSPQRVLGPYEPPMQGLVTLQAAAGSVQVGQRRLELTPREFQLLAALIQHAGRVLTRRQLIARVWGDESAHTDRVVDAHMKAIRRKLGEAKDCLETVRGVGYRFSDVTSPASD
jgi:DNA-binding response OmpR family regulator